MLPTPEASLWRCHPALPSLLLRELVHGGGKRGHCACVRPQAARPTGAELEHGGEKGSLRQEYASRAQGSVTGAAWAPTMFLVAGGGSCSITHDHPTSTSVPQLSVCKVEYLPGLEVKLSQRGGALPSLPIGLQP